MDNSFENTLINVCRNQNSSYICGTKANNMKSYLVLIQTESGKFEIRDFNANSKKSLYPMYRNYGIGIAITEWSSDNYSFLDGLKFRMENGK